MTRNLTQDTPTADCTEVQPEELTKSEVAAYFRVTKRTVTNWVRQLGLPCVKISRRTVRFKASAVREWEAGLSSRSQSPEKW